MSRYSKLTEEQKEKQRKKSREYAKAHREHLNEWAKQYRKNNPEWAKATQKRAREKLKATNPAHLMWMELKKRAKKRDIPFNLEVGDVVIPVRCPILDILLRPGKGRVHDGSPSMDRIIPSLGYIKGNVFVISSKANRMKQDNTLEDLKKLVQYIEERLQNDQNRSVRR